MWKQLECLSMDEWVQKICVQPVGLNKVFSLNKDVNSALLDNVNVTYGHNAKRNLTERQRPHESTYINFENN